MIDVEKYMFKKYKHNSGGKNMNRKNVFSSEAVTKGHPDKVCDQISDAIVDEYILQDSLSRVACETMIMPGKVIVAGEISSRGNVIIEDIVKRVLEKVDYRNEYHGVSPKDVIIESNISLQSADIAQGVNCSYESKKEGGRRKSGAGDQGIMHGYATCETPEYMPISTIYAQKIVKKIDSLRECGEMEYILSDGKSQVSVEYLQELVPHRIEAIVVSVQHLPNIDMKQLKRDLKDKVLSQVIPNGWIDENTKIFINPTGRFVSGGAKADCGLTGRKIIVDTYGGRGGHGGGAFSGKDPSKVDRSGAYMARYIAKNLVASGICKHIDVQIAYAIGVAEPVGVYVNTFGTGKISDSEINYNVRKILDLSPDSIIKKFDLLRPIYEKLAVYGHFGRDEEDYKWENIDYYYLGM